MLYGYHKEFLESMEVDVSMLAMLPEDMIIETLSAFDIQYVDWV